MAGGSVNVRFFNQFFFRSMTLCFEIVETEKGQATSLYMLVFL